MSCTLRYALIGLRSTLEGHTPPKSDDGRDNAIKKWADSPLWRMTGKNYRVSWCSWEMVDAPCHPSRTLSANFADKVLSENGGLILNATKRFPEGYRFCAGIHSSRSEEHTSEL